MTCPHAIHFIHTHSGHSPSFCILSEWPLLSIPPSKASSLLWTKHTHRIISLLQQPSWSNSASWGISVWSSFFFSVLLHAFHKTPWTENAQQRFIVLIRLRGNPVVFIILFSANNNEGKLERGMTTRLSFLPSLYFTFKGEDGWGLKANESNEHL